MLVIVHRINDIVGYTLHNLFNGRNIVVFHWKVNRNQVQDIKSGEWLIKN